MLLKATRRLTEDEYREAHTRLYAFLLAAWHIIEPSTEYLNNWHIQYLCEWLECITFGETPTPECCAALGISEEPIHAIVFNIPPRYMKSVIVTIMWPCWEWQLFPHLRYLCASYSDKLSTSHSVKRRRILESPWYQTGCREYWGVDVALVDDQNLKTHYTNSQCGEMISTSVGGTATGEGGDRVIVDDPVNPRQADSDAKRLEANEFFDLTLSTRLNDKARGAFVVVMQRLHQKDFTGHVLAEGEWVNVRIPCVADDDETYVFPRSGRVVTRRGGGIQRDDEGNPVVVGELLWSERENARQVLRVMRRLGSYGFAGQYQQRPTAAEGGMIKRSWIRYWTRELMPDDDASVMLLPANLTAHRQSWDMGLWGREKDDWTVGLVGARLGANVYVLDCDRRRLDLPGCISAVNRMTARWPKAVRKVIEKAANGSEVLRLLQGKVAGLIPVSWHTSKEARVAAASPFFEGGNVIFPHPREAGWVPDAIEELVTFPFVEHDDFTDALTQMVLDFDRSPGEGSGVGFGRPDDGG